MPTPPLPNLRTLLRRGWRKKCPQCGQGDLYQRWLRLKDRCPVCGLQYLADQGDLMGPLMLLDRVLFIVPIVVFFFLKGWHPSLGAFAVFCGIMLFLFVYTVPNRNGVSVAFDYLMRRKSGDLADTPPGER